MLACPPCSVLGALICAMRALAGRLFFKLTLKSRTIAQINHKILAAKNNLTPKQGLQRANDLDVSGRTHVSRAKIPILFK